MAIGKANTSSANPLQHHNNNISHLWVEAVALALKSNAAMTAHIPQHRQAGDRGEESRAKSSATVNGTSQNKLQNRRRSVKYEMSRTPHFIKSSSFLAKARQADGDNYKGGVNKKLTMKMKHHRDFMGNNYLGDCGESLIWMVSS